MHVLSGPRRCSVAAVIACLNVLALGNASADDSAGHSPFGVLKRESFADVARVGAAEHQALFSRPEETPTDPWGAAAPSTTPVDDLLLAAPVVPAGQEIATSSTNRLLPRPRPDKATTETLSPAARSGMPAADVVFAAPVFPTVEGSVKAPTDMPLPPWRLQDAMTDARGPPAQSSRPADAVIFAAPVLPASQEMATGWTSTPLPPRRPDDATTDRADIAAQGGRPADAVVFAASASPADQESATGPANTLLPSPLVATTVDAVVFGPATRGADSPSMSDRLAGPSSLPAPPRQATFGRALAPEEAARLKARARELLANGALAPARALLEDASSRGDAEGAYLLAQTYDPEALTRSGMIGVAGDAAKAEALYRAAQLGGYRRPDKNARAAQP